MWVDPNFYYGIAIIPIGWGLFYGIFDNYEDIYRMSRMSVLIRTIFLSFFGVLFLFFTLMLDDIVTDYRTYYTSFLTLLGLHFLLTVVSRMIILTWASRRLKKGIRTFRTLLIGGEQRACLLYTSPSPRDRQKSRMPSSA